VSLGSLLIEAVVIFILILLNGFFSGAEIAIISSKRSSMDRLSREGRRSAKVVSRMKDDPEKFLATIQIGVTVVSTLASVIGGVAAAEFLKPVFRSIPIEKVRASAEFLSVGVVVVVISFALLIMGELVPKSLALRYADRIACLSARPLELLSSLSSVLVGLLTASTRGVLRLMGIKDAERKVFVSEEEIRYYISEGRTAGILEETEAALLHGVFEFADTTVKDVMIPKHKFGAIEVSTSGDELLKIISQTGFSRYPVYSETLDRVVGLLFHKDVFRAMERGAEVTASALMRPPYFVPGSIMISRLLREMQRRKQHMAIVVDEHGDVDGLVTIEDILEEIVGEIEDEYDIGKGGLVERLADGTLIVDASASLRDIEEFGIHIDVEDDDEEYHTLAGFMLARLQRIPRGGEFVVYKETRFTVVDVEANRIVKVKVEPVGTGAGEKASA